MHKLSEDPRCGPYEMNLKGTLLYTTIVVVGAGVIDLRGTEEPIESFRDVSWYYGFSFLPLFLSFSFLISYMRHTHTYTHTESRVNRILLSDDIAAMLQGRQSDKYMDMPSRKWMVNL